MMSWTLIKEAYKFRFINETSNHSIDEFTLSRANGSLKLEMIGDSVFLNKMIDKITLDANQEREFNIDIQNGKCICHVNKPCWIEMCLLALCDVNYIKKSHRREIRDQFALNNLFYNDRRAGGLVIFLYEKHGYSVALKHANREMTRTDGESSCMDMLMEYHNKENESKSMELKCVDEAEAVQATNHTQRFNIALSFFRKLESENQKDKVTPLHLD